MSVLSLVICEFVVIVGEYALFSKISPLIRYKSICCKSVRHIGNSLGGPTNAPFISIKLTTFAEVTKIRPLSMSVNALAASCDVVITTILCTLLQHSRTGFQISDTIINKLIMFSISTGLLTSACAVMSLVSVCNKSQLAHVALTT